MGNTVSPYVGDDCCVLGLLQGRINYAGMPNPGTFSLVHKRDVGANYAHNLFCSTESRDIAVGAVQVRVESVTPDMITIRAQHGVESLAWADAVSTLTCRSTSPRRPRD